MKEVKPEDIDLIDTSKIHIATFNWLDAYMTDEDLNPDYMEQGGCQATAVGMILSLNGNGITISNTIFQDGECRGLQTVPMSTITNLHIYELDLTPDNVVPFKKDADFTQ